MWYDIHNSNMLQHWTGVVTPGLLFDEIYVCPSRFDPGKVYDSAL